MTEISQRSEANPVLDFCHVDFAYGAEKVLEDVCVTWPGTDPVCVVGPNGGGKSTLLKLALGLLEPDRGEIRLFGEKPAKAAHKVGYVPQIASFDVLFPITVHEVVGLGAQRGDRSAIDEALQQTELTALADRPFAALSGGQRQRTLLARALASRPRALFLDEPTAHADTTSEQAFHELLRTLRGTLPILVVTHDLDLVPHFFASALCVNRHVHLHPTEQLSGEHLQTLYGSPLRHVRHQQDLPGHSHHA